ncbi:type II toxin-antitoxin system RelE/ParE family toxin [Candidatus Woesearchaeota archaeon]|nr:type II toxin-antitoxin system RelE/ParE family toxin [Candidatus Woesearchaeota archaeon]
MKFSVQLSSRARKSLAKLGHESLRIRRRLSILTSNPIPQDAKFIRWHEGDKVFRLRIGKYRALYKVQRNTVLVVKIDKRPSAYRP